MNWWCLLACLAQIILLPRVEAAQDLILRRNCVELESRPKRPPTFHRACLVWKQNGAREQNVIELEAEESVVKELEKHTPVYPWAKIELLEPKFGEQWLIIIYYADVDRPDGRTYFVSAYSLAAQRKVLSTYATDVRVADLDRDGISELVLYKMITPLKHGIPLGWPRIYRLSNHLQSVELREYPGVIGIFIREASSQLTKTRSICKLLQQDNKGGKCQYVEDIDIISAQIELAQSLLDSTERR